MEMKFEALEPGGVVVVLNGRMDIKGAMEMDLHFTATVAAHRRVIVDMRGVEFLASMGLRTLILGAKSVQSKSGRIVLLQPSTDVEAVLLASGTDSLIPVMHDRAEAESWVMAS